MDRLTIPGVIQRIEEQTGGKLKMSDFSPAAVLAPAVRVARRTCCG